MTEKQIIFAALLLAQLGLCCDTSIAQSTKLVPQLQVPQVRFRVSGKAAFLLEPPAASEHWQETPGKVAKPWVWYAPTLRDRYPGPEEAWMIRRFHDQGIAVAGIDVGESYGSPAGTKHFQQFYEKLTQNRGYAKKCVLLARSRGGLMLYNWAVEHPDCVAAIAGIYPVCNIASYPGVDRAAAAYEMTPAQLRSTLSVHNPIDRLADLAAHKVPILHIHGEPDRVVPLAENSNLLADRYRKLGGPVRIDVIADQGHNMWQGWFQSEELTKFVITHATTATESNHPTNSSTVRADLVVYGGTASAVIAAVQAKKMGKSAVIVCPDKHLGGLTSGGLGFTDTGNKAVIGGLARDFYHRIWSEYQKSDAWRWQEKSDYGNKGQGTPAIDGKNRTMWIFEPHVAERVFEDYIREFDIPVYREQWLDRKQGVLLADGHIKRVATLAGLTFEGQMYIDATYEGDLMAAAGVDYHVGREANSVYGEQWNGVQTGVLHHRHHFGVLKEKISPYVIPGDPDSGVLPRISTSPPGEYGSADNRVQAYCYRYCATNHPENRVPFPKPSQYDPREYALLARIYEAGWRETFNKFDPIPNRKTDTNNHGPFSTDNIGMNYDYPEASYERRREILDEHRRYQQGWLYFVSHDPSVPSEVRDKMQQWGLAADEFTDNGNWPHQIYVREARRMVGSFVMTENELTKRRPTPDPVGMGSYTIDSHNVQRYITPEGYVQNEGDIGVGISPYTISYGSLVPKRSQCRNLLVSVCVSSSHIAFGSIRMEPVFMILGQSAATGAAYAIDDQVPVQDVDYLKLRRRLEQDGQVLDYVDRNPSRNTKKTIIPPQRLPGIVVDDHSAKLSGNWKYSSSTPSYVGAGYRHDGEDKTNISTARFEATLPRSGQYEVLISWPAHPNRSSNTKVQIVSANATTEKTIDQREKPSEQTDQLFRSLGSYTFSAKKPAILVVSNEGTDGYTVVDAVQWLAK